MVEIDITLSRIEDSVILISGETAKTVETSTQFINYFFFTATSVNYTASTMTLKYDAHAGWTPDACLVICTNDPSNETYAIRITTPKFSSSTSSVEYRTVYAEGRIQTDSPLVSSSYNIGVRSNGCPKVERFILSYETFDDDREKTLEYNSGINFNVEYIIEKNIANFTDTDPSAKMLHIAARRVWDVNDSDFDTYANDETSYTKEKYKTCSGETSSTLGKNTRIYRNDKVVKLGAGFYKTSGSSFDELSYTATYREIEDGDATVHRVDLEFNEPLEAIGYHTFYLGKHYNGNYVPAKNKDDYIAYYDSVGDSYYYFPGEESQRTDGDTFFDGKLSCTYVPQRGTDYVTFNGAKRVWKESIHDYYGESNQNEYLFEESDNIKGIKTGKYLKIIGNQTFKKLKGLKYIDFEDSPLERIGMYAFERCESLSNITIPDTVSLIGEGAFKRSGIKSVIIPSRMEMIEAETFRLCQELEEVDFSNCTRLHKICNDAFRGCWHITGLTFPSSLRRIERMAFGECSSLTSVTFNRGLLYIGYRAFDKCSHISALRINATTIGNKAFNECSGLTSVTFTSNVRTIGKEAFARCSLSSVTLPSSSALTIGERAFYHNNMHSVNIPSDISSIGQDAFNGTEFVVYQGNATGSPWGAEYAVAVIRDGFAYEDSGMTTLVTYEYNNVQSILIPISVTLIKEGAFNEFSQLGTAIISNSVRTIGKRAFYYCTALTDVTIGTSVTSIGQEAFCYCKMLSAVTIPSSVRTIGPEAFTDCIRLENLIIQNGTTGISNSAFANCNSLTDVSIPNSVSEIGGSAFNGCTGLRTLTFGTGITTLGQSAFVNCSGLRTIVIPSTVTGIPSYCFCNCTSLTYVQIGTGVTTVNNAAFSGCTSLNTIKYDGTKEQWRDNVSRPSYTWYAGVPASAVTCSNGTYPIG